MEVARKDNDRFWSVRFDNDTEEWEVVCGEDVFSSSELKVRAQRVADMLNQSRPSELDPGLALERIGSVLEEILKRVKAREGSRDLVRLCRNALKYIGPSKSTQRNRARKGLEP